MRLSANNGSSPLELVALSALLVLPIGFAIPIFQQLSNQLAAESIARHALRLAILQNPERPSSSFPAAVELLADNWMLEAVGYDFWCSAGCSLVTLEVFVGQASAIQTMGIPKS